MASRISGPRNRGEIRMVFVWTCLVRNLTINHGMTEMYLENLRIKHDRWLEWDRQPQQCFSLLNLEKKPQVDWISLVHLGTKTILIEPGNEWFSCISAWSLVAVLTERGGTFFEVLGTCNCPSSRKQTQHCKSLETPKECQPQLSTAY